MGVNGKRGARARAERVGGTQRGTQHTRVSRMSYHNAPGVGTRLRRKADQRSCFTRAHRTQDHAKARHLWLPKPTAAENACSGRFVRSRRKSPWTVDRHGARVPGLLHGGPALPVTWGSGGARGNNDLPEVGVKSFKRACVCETVRCSNLKGLLGHGARGVGVQESGQRRFFFFFFFRLFSHGNCKGCGVTGVDQGGEFLARAF